jgi:hypothetical protein
MNSFQLKGYVPKIKKEFIWYRSYKNFDNETFIDDLRSVNVENLTSVDDHQLK